VVRRFGDFADSEDAVQEAMLDAARQWPAQGLPENPTGWLVHVASRRITDRIRSESARRGREEADAAEPGPGPAADADDTLVLMLMCCHPALSSASAIALTLRAVGGLTTAEIAAAFLVPEATMGQRIGRAKKTIAAAPEPFAMPGPEQRVERLREVMHVVYLIFNEGYLASAGEELARAELSAEAIRLARILRLALPDDPEVAGLLALLLLTDSRRNARADARGEIVPLEEQDRSLWDRGEIEEGLRLLAEALRRGAVGEYQLQAAIAAEHARAAAAAETNWSAILGHYGLLERVTENPMVTLNRAIAAAMAGAPEDGLAVLDGLEEPLGDHHRFHSTRAHLLEMAGEDGAAAAAYERAAVLTNSLPERNYLTKRAAALNSRRP
jgi:predicted RNA polymerase sigma factor